MSDMAAAGPRSNWPSAILTRSIDSSVVELPGPPPKFFFAPDQIGKRIGEWGPQGFGEQLGGAWSRFHAHVDDPQRDLLRIKEGEGLDDARQVFEQLLAGRVAPREGHVIRLHG